MIGHDHGPFILLGLVRLEDFTANGHQDTMYQKANCGFGTEVPLYFLY